MKLFKKLTTLFTGLTMALAIGLVADKGGRVEKAKAEEGTIGTLTIERSSFGDPKTALSSYADRDWSGTTSTGEKIDGKGVITASSNQNNLQTTNTGSGLNGCIRNTNPLPGNIISVTGRMFQTTARAINVMASSAAMSVGTGANDSSVIATTATQKSVGTFTPDSTSADTVLTLSSADQEAGYRYFLLYTTGGASYISYYIITYFIPNEISEIPEEVQDVMDLIDDIGDVTLESEAKIIAAEEAYEALSPEDQLLVENYELLEAARAAYDFLVEQENNAQGVADAFMARVNALYEGVVTADDGAEIADIEADYALLQGTALALVNAESYATKMANIKSRYDAAVEAAQQAADQAVANVVIGMIDALPEANLIDTDNYETYEEAANAADAAYGDLTATQKGLVTNYSKLEAVLAAIVAANPTPINIVNSTFDQGVTMPTGWTHNGATTHGSASGQLQAMKLSALAHYIQIANFSASLDNEKLVKKYIVTVINGQNSATANRNVLAVTGLNSSGSLIASTKQSHPVTDVTGNISGITQAQALEARGGVDVFELAGSEIQNVQGIRIGFDTYYGNWVVYQVRIDVIYGAAVAKTPTVDFTPDEEPEAGNGVVSMGDIAFVQVMEGHDYVALVEGGAQYGTDTSVGKVEFESALVTVTPEEVDKIIVRMSTLGNAVLSVFVGNTQIGNTVALTDILTDYEFIPNQGGSQALGRADLEDSGHLKIVVEGNGITFGGMSIYGAEEAIEAGAASDMAVIYEMLLEADPCVDYTDAPAYLELLEELDAADQATVRSAIYVSKEGTVETLGDKLDYMLGLYEAELAKTSGLNPLSQLVKSSSSLIAILVIGITGLTAIGAYYFINKKRLASR